MIRKPILNGKILDYNIKNLIIGKYIKELSLYLLNFAKFWIILLNHC